MIKAYQLSIFILMGTSILVLMLESIGNRPSRLGLSEKPHIRLLAIGAIIVSFLLVFLEIMGKGQISRRPYQFLNELSSLSLLVNALIAIFLGRRTLSQHQTGETYFLVLASLALAVSNVSSASLIIKILASTGFLVVMNTLAIKTTPGGKKAEIGMKLSFTTAIVMVLFISALFFLLLSDQPADLELFTPNPLANNMDILGATLLALAALALAGIPPFHFGHVDCADGGNISVAFLLLGNSFIQGCSLLQSVKTIFIKSGEDITSEANILGFMLIFGFMILWLRALDQSKIRRTIAYIATSVGPLFSMSILFGASVLLPKLIFILAIFTFLTLGLFTIFGALAYMDPINQSWQTWEDMSGFGRQNPMLTLTFMVAVASIAGLPGTLGYFVKLSLIAPLQDNFIFSGSIFFSIAIGAACVMRVFVFMFSKHTVFAGRTFLHRPPTVLLLASFILVALGFFPFVR